MAVKIDLPYVVRDAIHGNITFSELEKSCIDTPLFQRLRSISQLGFLKYIFPSSNHTRFEHSLGVMHLSGKIFRSLVENQKVLLASLNGSEESAIQETVPYLELLDEPALLQRIRLAGLLHDLGHGPYSHATECFTNDITPEQFLAQPLLTPALKSYFKEKLERGSKVTHEWISMLMILEIFKELDIDDPGLPGDILSIIDPEIPLTADTAFTTPEIRYLLHDIVSSEMDSDRMDYLLRDSHAAGINYGIFDLERLLKNICFIVSPGSSHPRMSIMFQGLMAFEDYLFRRYQMYLQVYTQKTNSSMEAMLGRIRESVSIEYPLAPAAFLEFTDSTFPQVLLEAIKESDEEKLLVDLWEHIFKMRNPWKTIFLGSSLGVDEEDPRMFSRILEILKNSPYKNDFIYYEGGRSLTRYTPQLGEGSSTSFKVIRRDPIGDSTGIIDLFRYSYLISAFQKPVRTYRIFIHPERAQEISSYLQRKLKDVPD